MEFGHIPVMLTEVLEALAVKPGGKYIDCTLGGAGYTLAIAEKCGSKGKILGIDMDRAALANAEKIKSEKGIKNITVCEGNFKNITDITAGAWGENTLVDGIVMDLGLSSFQLADEKRGFSFKHGASLDMAFGPEAEADTTRIINTYSLLELTRIFREFGEDKRAYMLAKAIVEARKKKPITTAAELATLVESKVPMRFRGKIHPATRIFQALRMETNGELDNLRTVLPAAIDLLAPGGRLVVVSFHSGEDRIVKHFFKDNESLKILTKRPLVPTDEEAAVNPRSRSAKLRAAAKLKDV